MLLFNSQRKFHFSPRSCLLLIVYDHTEYPIVTKTRDSLTKTTLQERKKEKKNSRHRKIRISTRYTRILEAGQLLMRHD